MKKLRSTKKPQQLDWYQEIATVAAQWAGWRRKYRFQGEKMTVAVETEEFWHSLGDRFYLRFYDNRKGYWDVSFEKSLRKLKKTEIGTYLKRSEKYLDLEVCPACNHKAFLSFNASCDAKVCSLCETKSYIQMNKQMVNIEKKKTRELYAIYKRKGYSYVLNAWIHPKKGGNDFFYRKFFTVKPTKAQIELILKKKKSAIINDYNIEKI